jgi:hypothetical protein
VGPVHSWDGPPGCDALLKFLSDLAAFAELSDFLICLLIFFIPDTDSTFLFLTEAFARTEPSDIFLKTT